MRRIRLLFWLLAAGLMASPVWAQQQYQGLCAGVKIVISQRLTLERVGFLATLQITDNDGTAPITDFAANLTFENPALSTNGTVNDSSSLFFVQPPTLQDVTGVDGTGAIQPGETATISWFIIPTVNAGGTTPAGVAYNVGATLSGTINGTPIPAPILLVIPAPITVQPDAQLQITYFTPRDTIGTDPFTGLGSPIPFTFGVLVQNVGYGPASNVIVQSQQPKIVQNVQNLVLVAQLLGSRVNDSPLSNANLTVNLGNLNPGQAAKGAWDMITTLSGTFVSVNATYQHSTALGGQETSLIKSVNAYLFLHEVLDDQPGRDNIRDFLADTAGALDSVANLIPDSLYESQGGVFPVNLLTNVTLTGSGSAFQLNLSANVGGWGYMRLNDPGQAMRPIVSVVRSDGKVLNTNNYWTSIHYEPATNFKDTYLNIFDLVNLGNYSYTVTYAPPPSNTTPPVTTLMFAGPSTVANGVYYTSPNSQIYFLGQGVAPVTIYYQITNSPYLPTEGSFLPAYPFTLNPGSYQLAFYGIDGNGNQETTHNVTLVINGPGFLGFANVTVPSQQIFNPGGALSIRPGFVPVTFQAQPNPTAINAQVDVFQGVVAWATLSNAPSFPTASTSASLTVGGANVDYFMYQLNGGSWSAEQPVSSPITLAGLPSGSNYVSVLGRSQYGSYLGTANALTVGWVVDPSAPPTVVTGAPATPALGNSATLSVAGTGVGSYRWTINNSYYQAPVTVANPILISNLNIGTQVVAVLGMANGVTQSMNDPTTVAWTIDPLYGYDLSSLGNLTSITFSNIGAGPVTYNWNGRNAAGVIQPPGWYSVRVTLTDSLGDTNFFVGLAQVSSLAGPNTVIAGVNRGPQNPYARGPLAVWQDQSDGGWQIYAQNVSASVSPILKLTSSSFSQQNPRTDGRYVVWQGQQANGSWDVYMDDLNGTSGPQAVTSTPNLDEINPAIDWPWIVCQVRQTGLGPTAPGLDTVPWQLVAYNVLTQTSFAVSPSGQDEISPDVQASRVVWQDFRNPGAGEIYFANLQTGQLQRITTNLFGKYNPAIYGNWIVWADARNIELDLYGYDFLRRSEVRITSTPEDETQPYLNGPWVVCMENSLGPQTGNARLVHLPSLVTVPVTRTATMKVLPGLADGWAVWQETIGNQSQIISVALPSLQGVFQNSNAVAVTPAMVSYAINAYGLLALWASNGVESLTQYSSLTPQVATQTASLSNGAFSGPNFNLVPGSFLWVGFNSNQVLDLGLNNTVPINLAAGANVFGYSQFPDAYHAFDLLRQLGLNNVLSTRMLDSQSGRWRVALVENGSVTGDNFPIPNTAVIMVNMANAVSQFSPQFP